MAQFNSSYHPLSINPKALDVGQLERKLVIIFVVIF